MLRTLAPPPAPQTEWDQVATITGPTKNVRTELQSESRITDQLNPTVNNPQRNRTGYIIGYIGPFQTRIQV